MLSTLTFFISESFISLRRNGLMTMVAVGTITVSLCIFGFFLLSIINMSNIVSNLGTKVDLVAYASQPLTDTEAENVRLQISRIDGVKEAKWISKDKAWKDFKEEFSDRLKLEEIVDSNPLPDTFFVKMLNPELSAKVSKEIARISLIEEVGFNPNLVDKIETLVEAFRIGGLMLVFLLSLATLLIVVNTIRLTVLARETEIVIMRLVGATRSFIRWPFIIEGIILGMLGSGISIVIIKFTYEAIIVRLQNALPFVTLFTNHFWIGCVYFLVAIVGVLLGMLGGYISVNKQLKEEN
ncbi:MAG: permease-like cell division protein FtsX [Candidatus Saganbacteria bacterium]|nr:permease-like cell division protein FtsX [Candidatus Saganbacteria bacterium]